MATLLRFTVNNDWMVQMVNTDRQLLILWFEHFEDIPQIGDKFFYAGQELETLERSNSRGSQRIVLITVRRMRWLLE